jgi:hypothetical protein
MKKIVRENSPASNDKQVRTEMPLSTARSSSVSDSRRINDELIGNNMQN